jgi:hypothetical protein
MACIVMLFRRELPGADPDDGMRWSRGDPVDVLEYDARLGERETPVLSQNFIGLILLDADWEETHLTLAGTYDDEAADVHLIRAYHFHVDELPATTLAQMEATGYLEMTYAQARPYIRHRITGECW